VFISTAVPTPDDREHIYCICRVIVELLADLSRTVVFLSTDVHVARIHLTSAMARVMSSSMTCRVRCSVCDRLRSWSAVQPGDDVDEDLVHRLTVSPPPLPSQLADRSTVTRSGSSPSTAISSSSECGPMDRHALTRLLLTRQYDWYHVRHYSHLSFHNERRQRHLSPVL